MHVITGATGLAGSHLVYELCRRGLRVRALRRASSDTAPARRLFSENPHLFEQIEWVAADVLDIPSLEDAFEGAEAVYHCAASVSFVPAELQDMQKINVDGTANVVNTCLAKGVPVLCHMSSVATLDRTVAETLIHEGHSWNAGLENSNYAISKYGAEREVWRGMAEGLGTVVVNPAIILGPGDWKRSSDAIFRKIWEGLPYYSDGSTGWVDARDVATVMASLVEKGIRGERFILIAENLPYRTVFDWVADSLGKSRPSIHANAFLRAMAWRLEALKCAVTGARPLITRETAQSAGKKVKFSNGKIRSSLDIEFIPVRDSVSRTCALFLEDINKAA